ncbi:MAG: hypothetical protein GY946_13540 [bacterium]|nr:hypothetical protein [bacterium]
MHPLTAEPLYEQIEDPRDAARGLEGHVQPAEMRKPLQPLFPLAAHAVHGASLLLIAIEQAARDQILVDVQTQHRCVDPLNRASALLHRASLRVVGRESNWDL